MQILKWSTRARINHVVLLHLCSGCLKKWNQKPYCDDRKIFVWAPIVKAGKFLWVHLLGILEIWNFGISIYFYFLAKFWVRLFWNFLDYRILVVETRSDDGFLQLWVQDVRNLPAAKRCPHLQLHTLIHRARNATSRITVSLVLGKHVVKVDTGLGHPGAGWREAAGWSHDMTF